MAQSNEKPAPADNFTFKGHQQPPTDERLLQARNFLADEDIKRCLNFTSRLAEIEELLKHIETEKLPYNKYLFGDVKTMAEVHRDWIGRMDKPPSDHEGPDDVRSIQNYSTRLIDADTNAELQLERESYGMVTQMRDDHPPFTVERSADHLEFLTQMKKDACTNPIECDRATNLHFVEHRAYHWALRQPSLIPFWMHWSKGLPNKGIKASDPLPWYRANPRTRPAAPKNPLPSPHNVYIEEALPDYLQRREDEINRLLKVYRSAAASSKLVDLLTLHAPLDLQQLYDEYKYLASIKDLLTAEESSTLPSMMLALERKFMEWVETFRFTGVQIRLSHSNWADPDKPGHFYIKIGQPTSKDHSELQEREERINQLLSLPDASINEEHLWTELADFVPEGVRRCEDRAQAILIKAGKITKTAYDAMCAAKRDEFNSTQLNALNDAARFAYNSTTAEKSRMLQAWLGTLRFTTAILRYLCPGEIPSRNPRQLYLPWTPETKEAVPELPEEVRKLGSEINDLLYAIDTEGRGEKDQSRLDLLLTDVMYPHLAEMRRDIAALKERGIADANVLTNLENRCKNAHHLWRECLISRKSEIRIPQNGNEDFNPGVLYYRGPSKGLLVPPNSNGDLDKWAEGIVYARRGKERDIRTDGAGFNNHETAMYQYLAHLQYPVLKRMDLAWRELEAISTPGAKAVQDAKSLWEVRFKDWMEIICYHDGPITIKQADADDGSLGDPGVIYYRGPVKLAADSDLLPEVIEKQVNQIRVLIKKYKTKKDLLEAPETLKQLEHLLRPFWRPAREYQDHQDFKETVLPDGRRERNEGLMREFRHRLVLFITESARLGFRVRKLPSGGYEAADPTAQLTERWKIQEFRHPSDTNSQYFGELLKDLWVYPKRFYRTLEDMEIEINERLRALSPDHPSTEEENGRLLQLLRPFPPKSVRTLDRRLKASREPLSQQMREWFTALWTEQLQKLQRCARTKWIKILVVDKSKLFADSFSEFQGRLYFAQPSDGDAKSSPQIKPGEPLPLRFQRYQSEINQLLKKRKLLAQSPDQMPLSWKENDRLRQLLHLAMDPVMAKLDDELREMDDNSRADVLQGEELTSFLNRLELWHARYNEWIDSFPDDGIQLRGLNEETPQYVHEPGVKLVDIRNDRLLPPKFRNRGLPRHVEWMTHGFNKALRAKNLTQLEQDALFRQYLPLITATYREHLSDLRRDYLATLFPESSRPKKKSRLSLEHRALLDCVRHKFLKSIWKALRQIATKSRETGTVIEIYEPLRGELRIRVVTADTQAAADDESDTSDVKMLVPKESLTNLPGFDEAKAEYLQLVEKLQAGTMTAKERTKIKRLLNPLSETELSAQDTETGDLMSKYFDGEAWSDTETAHAKELILRSLWQQFGRNSGGVVERTFPELSSKKSLETLLESTRHQRPPLNDRPPTEAEVREMGIVINNLLQKNWKGKITQTETTTLDYLLRPFVNDRLRELDRQMETLNLKPSATDQETTPYQEDPDLNARQSLHLIELESQWAREFPTWKSQIPEFGLIINEWACDPDTLFEAARRFRVIRQAPNFQLPVTSDRNDPEIFSVLKKYIIDSTFTDKEGNLMLDQLPADVAASRDAFFKRRAAVVAQTDEPRLKVGVSMNMLKHKFVMKYMTWYNALPLQRKMAPNGTDFIGKAERRGVQRAAVELALNLLATNQEQHRPLDRFRTVELPKRYKSPPKEVSLCLPLEPWNRPIEQEPFEITKLMLRYRKWKDSDYSAARARARARWPGYLEAPVNYNGPSALLTHYDLHSRFAKKQQELVQVQKDLIRACEIAPRDLIYQLITIINDTVLLPLEDPSHPRVEDDWGETPLETKDIDILRGLCESSWNERQQPYPHPKEWTESVKHERARLKEFERDVNIFMDDLPLWKPRGVLNQERPEGYIWDPYNPQLESVAGWDLKTLVHDKINAHRQEQAHDRQPVHMWTDAEAIAHLTIMHNAGRIHFQPTPGRQLISRIPLTGHPENKYILAPDEVKRRDYIQFNKDSNEWEVQYNAAGEMGRPILQPNFHQYLRDIAYRVGRDIRQLHEKISYDHNPDDRLNNQFALLRATCDLMDGGATEEHGDRLPDQTANQPADRKQVSLGKIACDLHQVAPDLMEEAQVDLNDRRSERAPATLIQMQLIQESNNNWDSLFPENEHVWDFAAPRVSREQDETSPMSKPRIVQYFNVRRWPLWCQSEEAQAQIESNSLRFEEKPAPKAAPAPRTREKTMGRTEPSWPREQYTGYGGPPLFPFGETPYQQAFLSWRMEQDLADVEEFNPKWPRKGFFSRRKKEVEKPYVNPYALPEIPEGWTPDSVSLKAKWYDVTERLRLMPDFPRNLEYYYTDEEIAEIRDYQTHQEDSRLKAEAVAMVEEREGRPISELTRAEIQAAQHALGINPWKEILTNPPPVQTSWLGWLFGRRPEHPPLVQRNSHACGAANVIEDDDEDEEMEFMELGI